jgi:hypothetical protein
MLWGTVEKQNAYHSSIRFPREIHAMVKTNRAVISLKTAILTYENRGGARKPDGRRWGDR